MCSNSLKSDTQNTAPWLLKEEMRRAGSLLMELARQHAVPAGHALAVDRELFSQAVTAAIEGEPLIRIVREEVTAIDEDAAITIIASGPLTSDALAAEIQRLSGSEQLFFYDSISPIVEADTIDMSRAYMAARYDKGTADYINCPMTREEYDRFLDALLEAQSVDAKEWEKLNYFESCLPIEEIARRGRDTLRFGPMKPVGLRDPRTGHLPYAVVQLRQENLRADSYNLVGFQNHLKFGEQARILRLIPGPGECEVPALRPDSSQHLHQGAGAAGRDAADEAASAACCSRDRSPASKATSSPSPPDCWRGCRPRRSPRKPRQSRLRARPPSARWCTTSATPRPSTSSRPTSPSTCCSRWTRRRRRRVRDKKQRHAMVCDRALADLQPWLEAHGVAAAKP